MTQLLTYFDRHWRITWPALVLACVVAIVALQTAYPVQAQSGVLVVAPGQVVTLSADATYTGITVNAGGELRFAPSASVTISSTGNVIISGTLTMKPSSAAIVQTLRFVGINEANYVGGGMVPLASDVGLWVMGAGKLDIAGTTKTSWTHAAGSVAAGTNQLVLSSVPVGWRVGDTVSIVPSEPVTVGTPSNSGFDLRTITAINGATVTLNSPTTRAHPIAINPFDGSIYTAEVLNLTRNVRIEGTGDGGPSPATNHRAHIFIHSTQAQSIRYLEASHLGPRKPDSGYTLDVLGRYGIHFHMAGDGSRGSLVEGVVVRDSGAHAFVPHASHGITFKDTISYNTFDDSFWWDPPTCGQCTDDVNDTDDLLVDRAVSALVRSDPLFRGYRLGGFVLGQGEVLTITNSVAVGIQGNGDAAGYKWPEQGFGLWEFEHNVTHNNRADGIFVWQNTGIPHLIKDSVSFRNGETGIDHGAYGNVYQYRGMDLFDNGAADIRSRASSTKVTRPDGYGQAFEHMRLSGTFEIAEHNATYGAPTLIKDSQLNQVRVTEKSLPRFGLYDFVNVTKPDGSPLQPADFAIVFAWPSSVYRVQNGYTAWQMGGDGTVTTIAPFYILPLSQLAQQVKDILDTNPTVRQELIAAGVISGGN